MTTPILPLSTVTSAIAPLPEPVNVTSGMLEYVLTAAAGVYPTPGLIISRSFDPLIVAIPEIAFNVALAPSLADCFIFTPFLLLMEIFDYPLLEVFVCVI